MNDIRKSPVNSLGYHFIEPGYLPKGKDEYYLRNLQRVSQQNSQQDSQQIFQRDPQDNRQQDHPKRSSQQDRSKQGSQQNHSKRNRQRNLRKRDLEQNQPGGLSVRYRQLTAYEIEVLVRNRNTSANWNHLLVSDAFTPELVQNCKFFGLVRIGKL